jgi:hypothetical protein
VGAGGTGHASIIHREVQGAEGGDGLGDRGFHRGRIADVDRDGFSMAAGFPDQVDRALSTEIIDVGHRDMGTLGGQADGDRGVDAGGGTGNRTTRSANSARISCPYVPIPDRCCLPGYGAQCGKPADRAGT